MIVLIGCLLGRCAGDTALARLWRLRWFYIGDASLIALLLGLL